MVFPRPGYEFTASLERPIWTPRGFVARGDAYLLTCHRGHEAPAPLQALIDAGEGDKLMHTFTKRWICATCGSKWIEVGIVYADGRRA